MMKSLLLTSLLSFFAIGLYAQEFEVPEDVALEEASDYAQYENDIIKCYEWLKEKGPGEEQDKKDEANKFMITWILGSPNVSIEINQKIVTFMESSPEMLSIFLGAWAHYSLTNDHSQDKVKCTEAALNAVIDYYETFRKELKKDKNIEAYIKMKAKDKKERTTDFEQYVKDNA